jgi:23S rRNA (cytidine1920-2'-O)/16S rRNA (cytidine1409-2'-O)-methyltransferase
VTRPRPERLDARLAGLGLAKDIRAAEAMVMAGRVRVDGAPALKPGQPVRAGQELSVVAEAHGYVGRGGVKLAAALDHFGFKVVGLECLDVGASTGGFTDCLLQRGAARVTAVDSGRGQLHPRLRNDPRVRCLERTNARNMEPSQLPAPPAFLCMDVSFISSSRLLASVAPLLAPGAFWVVLVKPQFELPSAEVPRGGVVADPGARERAVERVTRAALDAGLTVVGCVPSPITGAQGNVEFLLAGTKSHAVGPQ